MEPPLILYIMHVDIEGPETIAAFYEQRGFKSQIIKLYDGESLPQDFDGIEAVVCLGGPMNVYEEDTYPYLKAENIFIQRVITEEKPFLGICLGSQLLCKASGGQVSRSPQEEIGWRTVRLTPDGEKDPLFENLPQDILVYQWHGDMFSVPADASLLATGPNCPTQALRVGQNAYGLQFHIEITDKSIREWSEEYFQNSPSLLSEKKDMMLKEYVQNKALFEKEAENIYTNFLKIIRNAKA